jgi:hypothetical protein
MVRRMAVLPGSRAIVLVSPGFYLSAGLPGMQTVEDRAARSGIVINTLDGRGVPKSASTTCKSSGSKPMRSTNRQMPREARASRTATTTVPGSGAWPSPRA